MMSLHPHPRSRRRGPTSSGLGASGWMRLARHRRDNRYPSAEQGPGVCVIAHALWRAHISGCADRISCVAGKQDDRWCNAHRWPDAGCHACRFLVCATLRAHVCLLPGVCVAYCVAGVVGSASGKRCS